jgi:hypothetical protein
MMPGMPGYNAPSLIKVCGGWDFFASASFIYWQPIQDNMEVGLTNINPLATTALGAGTNQSTEGSFIQMNFSYKPGFKVGLGMDFDFDNWDSYAEYTYLHGTHHTSSNGPTDGFIFPTWGAPFVINNAPFYTQASSSFKCNLDIVDWVLGRNYFVGTKLMFHPVAGARAAWITESNSVKYTNSVANGVTGFLSNASGSNGATFTQTVVHARAHSWAIGPRVGLETNWMLGEGFRLMTDGYADILYTKYKVQTKTQAIALAANTVGPAVGNIQAAITRAVHVGAVRAHLDLEMGLGWGSYFANNGWHIDLSATYGFQVFFDQNMLRTFTNANMVGNSRTANGNLYTQGLTATARFDF